MDNKLNYNHLHFSHKPSFEDIQKAIKEYKVRKYKLGSYIKDNTHLDMDEEDYKELEIFEEYLDLKVRQFHEGIDIKSLLEYVYNDGYEEGYATGLTEK